MKQEFAMQNTKFKKGDIVWCTVDGKYTYTDYRVRCEVIDYNPRRSGDNRLLVHVIEPGCSTGGSDWWVDERLFCKLKAVIL